MLSPFPSSTWRAAEASALSAWRAKFQNGWGESRVTKITSNPLAPWHECVFYQTPKAVLALCLWIPGNSQARELLACLGLSALLCSCYFRYVNCMSTLRMIRSLGPFFWTSNKTKWNYLNFGCYSLFCRRLLLLGPAWPSWLGLMESIKSLCC